MVDEQQAHLDRLINLYESEQDKIDFYWQDAFNKAVYAHKAILTQMSIDVQTDNEPMKVYAEESLLEQAFIVLIKQSIRTFQSNSSEFASKVIKIQSIHQDDLVCVVYEDNAGSRNDQVTREQFDLESIKSLLKNANDGDIEVENLDGGLRVKLMLKRAKVSV